MTRIRELFRDHLRRVPALERHARLLARRRRLATEQPDWTAIIGAERAVWDQVVAAARGGPRVLMATSVGSHLAGTSLESALTAALTLRGAEVDVLLCDSMLPACLAADVTWYPNQSRFARHGPSRDSLPRMLRVGSCCLSRSRSPSAYLRGLPRSRRSKTCRKLGS